VETAAPTLLETILDLSRFHREHERFYAQAPLEQAVALQRWSRSLKALADRWQDVVPVERPLANRYAGCEDLNEKAAIDGAGIPRPGGLRPGRAARGSRRPSHRCRLSVLGVRADRPRGRPDRRLGRPRPRQRAAPARLPRPRRGAEGVREAVVNAAGTASGPAH
jgi:hypothetical protein